MRCFIGVAVLGLAMAGCQTTSEQREARRVVVVGKLAKLDFSSSIQLDCSSRGTTHYRIISGGKHGVVSFKKGYDFTNYPSDDPVSKCNSQKTVSDQIWYLAKNPNSTDVITVEVIFPSGASRIREYTVEIRG
jgi:hypothetical protein